MKLGFHAIVQCKIRLPKPNLLRSRFWQFKKSLHQLGVLTVARAVMDSKNIENLAKCLIAKGISLRYSLYGIY